MRGNIKELYLHSYGNVNGKPEVISPSLVKLIALEFGYDEDWIINGDE